MMKKMNHREITNQLKEELARMPQFRRGCAVCHCKSHPRGMTFHHQNYKNNERIHSDFPSGYAGTAQYYRYLKSIIFNEPQRFSYLCTPDHQIITRLSRYGEIKQKRIFGILRRSWLI